MRISWTVYVARIGRRGMHAGFWYESQKASDHYKELDAGMSIILKKNVREIGWSVMYCISLAEDGGQWRSLVNTVMNLRVR
jgi:hypothetical protein